MSSIWRLHILSMDGDTLKSSCVGTFNIYLFLYGEYLSYLIPKTVLSSWIEIQRKTRIAFSSEETELREVRERALEVDPIRIAAWRFMNHVDSGVGRDEGKDEGRDVKGGDDHEENISDSNISDSDSAEKANANKANANAKCSGVGVSEIAASGDAVTIERAAAAGCVGATESDLSRRQNSDTNRKTNNNIKFSGGSANNGDDHNSNDSNDNENISADFFERTMDLTSSGNVVNTQLAARLINGRQREKEDWERMKKKEQENSGATTQQENSGTLPGEQEQLETATSTAEDSEPRETLPSLDLSLPILDRLNKFEKDYPNIPKRNVVDLVICHCRERLTWLLLLLTRLKRERDARPKGEKMGLAGLNIFIYRRCKFRGEERAEWQGEKRKVEKEIREEIEKEIEKEQAANNNSGSNTNTGGSTSNTTEIRIDLRPPPHETTIDLSEEEVEKRNLDPLTETASHHFQTILEQIHWLMDSDTDRLEVVTLFKPDGFESVCYLHYLAFALPAKRDRIEEEEKGWMKKQNEEKKKEEEAKKNESTKENLEADAGNGKIAEVEKGVEKPRDQTKSIDQTKSFVPNYDPWSSNPWLEPHKFQAPFVPDFTFFLHGDSRDHTSETFLDDLMRSLDLGSWPKNRKRQWERGEGEMGKEIRKSMDKLFGRPMAEGSTNGSDSGERRKNSGKNSDVQTNPESNSSEENTNNVHANSSHAGNTNSSNAGSSNSSKELAKLLAPAPLARREDSNGFLHLSDQRLFPNNSRGCHAAIWRDFFVSIEEGHKGQFTKILDQVPGIPWSVEVIRDRRTGNFVELRRDYLGRLLEKDGGLRVQETVQEDEKGNGGRGVGRKKRKRSFILGERKSQDILRDIFGLKRKTKNSTENDNAEVAANNDNTEADGNYGDSNADASDSNADANDDDSAESEIQSLLPEMFGGYCCAVLLASRRRMAILPQEVWYTLFSYFIRNHRDIQWRERRESREVERKVEDGVNIITVRSMLTRTVLDAGEARISSSAQGEEGDPWTQGSEDNNDNLQDSDATDKVTDKDLSSTCKTALTSVKKTYRHGMDRDPRFNPDAALSSGVLEQMWHFLLGEPPILESREANPDLPIFTRIERRKSKWGLLRRSVPRMVDLETETRLIEEAGLEYQ